MADLDLQQRALQRMRETLQPPMRDLAETLGIPIDETDPRILAISMAMTSAFLEGARWQAVEDTAHAIESGIDARLISNDWHL